MSLPPVRPQNDDFDESKMFSNPVALKNQPTQSRAPHFGPSGPLLHKYYRMAGPHIKLATNGAYFPPGTIELTASGDIPVYPMTAADELLLKSPDALMSGLALEKLFESCVPAIKFPRLISVPDLDVLLLAIRVATYGDKMSLSANCPKCKEENSFDCDLPSLLSTLKFTDSDGSVKLNDEITVHVRPYNLENATKMALVTFEETRRLQGLETAGQLDGVGRASEVNKTMDILNKMNQQTTADCINSIVVPEGIVTDKSEIYDFMVNIPKGYSELIDKKITSLNKSGIDKGIKVSCISCEHEWHTEVEFDPANFFDAPSSK